MGKLRMGLDIKSCVLYMTMNTVCALHKREQLGSNSQYCMTLEVDDYTDVCFAVYIYRGWALATAT